MLASAVLTHVSVLIHYMLNDSAVRRVTLWMNCKLLSESPNPPKFFTSSEFGIFLDVVSFTTDGPNGL